MPLAQPDILLLDEPTNDLDDDGLSRLEHHVRRSRAGIALISHDRAFLAATVDQVVELDEFTRRTSEYGGGWDSFVTERAVEAYAAYEATRQQLTSAAARNGNGLARARPERSTRDGSLVAGLYYVNAPLPLLDQLGLAGPGPVRGTRSRPAPTR